MKTFKININFVIMVTIITIIVLLSSCEKESSEPEFPNPDDTEEPSEPGNGDSEDDKINGFIIGELRYKLNDNSADECYVAGMSEKKVINHLIIPSEVIIDGKPYRVTEIGDNALISALSVVTSDNMRVINGYAFTSDLQQLVVGANVAKVNPKAWNIADGPYESGTIITNGYRHEYTILSNYTPKKVSKIIWLPNTQPQGVTYRLGGKVNYVSEKYPDLLFTEVDNVPELTSLFWVDGILYTLKSPAERTCIAIGCDYNNNESLSLGKEVTNNGITLKITEYGNYVFANNPNIRHISTGDFTEINEGSFMYCNNVQTINFGDSLEYIYPNAFFECNLVKKLEFGPNVKEIKEKAFGDCSSLEEIIVNSSDESSDLEVSDYHPLSSVWSSKLKSIILYRNMRSWSEELYSNLFESAMNLTKVKMIGQCTTIYNNEFKNCSNLSDVELGDNITIIGEYAFSGCSAMESFIVGKSIKTIKQNAFSDCTGLKNFTTEALVPPDCGSQALQDIDKWKCILHVPDESIDLYKNTSQWKDFLYIE